MPTRFNVLLKDCERVIFWFGLKDGCHNKRVAFSLFRPPVFKNYLVIKKVDCETVRVFAHSSTREQSNKVLDRD